MEHSDLFEIVQRPLSPDTRVEVPANWEEYKRVDEILERDEAKYPQPWCDSVRGVAIVVAPPTPLHSGMTGALLTSISSEITRNLRYDSENKSNRYTSRGHPTRSWDGALQYREGRRLTLMIAVEVGVSQSYDSLQAAISWSVCALRCRLGLAMSISEGGRGETPPMRYYASIEEAEAAAEQSEDDFQRQLFSILFLGTYRREDKNCLPETSLEPSQSFMVLKDCIPSHLLSGRDIRATSVNFFYREWFESEFQASMISTAIVRVRHYGRHIP
ncbi:hypothetical protein V1521DRAFT_466441 [Lipomyces starkeyi]